MARVLKIDRKFYGSDGLVRLYRGDDWSFFGKVLDIVNGYETEVDLSQYSATAYFPGGASDCVPPWPVIPCPPFYQHPPAPGTVVAAPAVTGSCGQLNVSMPAASSVDVASMNGQAIYAVLADSSGKLETVVTQDSPVWVGDRGFYSDY